ncbi:MAG TPA: prenyltransferase/squalene oxidase repeat-containing protein [Gemmata sp.]|nr:prenyltransferase/squalene oxidase repeat-containing protein [Gemmata sp.]
MFRIAAFALLAFLLATQSTSPAHDDPPADPPKVKADDKKGGIDRSKATRKRLLKDFGGSEESEEAVMLGLAWLTQTQNRDGSWSFDRGGHDHDKATATGMALLAFLGAGQSHKEGRYKETVQAGLNWMVKAVEMDQNRRDRGRFDTITNMYSQGIATLSLCEAYGMTRDRTLKYPTQAAIDYIQRSQAANGSWGYESGNPGDTSIVGWQVQALYAAKLTQDLEVDDRVIQKAIRFLDFVGTGNSQEGKSVYGYTTPGGAPGTSLTAIGLLCRYYLNGWRADNNGFANGAKGLMRRAPSATRERTPLDLYYYYYATQVVRYFGGEEWKKWNEGAQQPDGTRKGGVPEWLISMQSKRDVDRGSWDSDTTWIGSNCGRHGTTCLCLLTLEVYYRYDPTQQKSSDARDGKK